MIGRPRPRPARPGLAAIVAATVLVVVLKLRHYRWLLSGSEPSADQARHRPERAAAAVEVLGAPVLVGLFGVAVALGTLGRVWSAPATLLAHLDLWGTAALGAIAAVLVNNLPAASLLAARRPTSVRAARRSQPRSESLRHGLAGLAPVAACGRAAGAQPRSPGEPLGVIAVPLSMAAALGALVLTRSANESRQPRSVATRSAEVAWRRVGFNLGSRSKVYGVRMTTISSLAGSMGLRPDTLRYYERVGLLEPAGRSAAGYRLYDEACAERLRFIKALQRMGLRLGDIKELLDVRDRGNCPCRGHTEVLVERRLAEVQVEVEQLDAVRDQLLVLKGRNKECMDVSVEDWSCAINGGKGGGT